MVRLFFLSAVLKYRAAAYQCAPREEALLSGCLCLLDDAVVVSLLSWTSLVVVGVLTLLLLGGLLLLVSDPRPSCWMHRCTACPRMSPLSDEVDVRSIAAVGNGELGELT